MVIQPIETPPICNHLIVHELYMIGTSLHIPFNQQQQQFILLLHTNNCRHHERVNITLSSCNDDDNV